MIRVVRTIEYEYADWETATLDISTWQLRSGRNTWNPFGSKKRARSRIDFATEEDARSPGRTAQGSSNG